MHSSVSKAFRVLKVIGGLILIVIGAGLFVIITSSINVARSMGPPMAIGFFSSYEQFVLFIFVLDLIFASLILGGVKLADFSWSVFGWLIIAAGMAVFCLGIWHQIDGPPLDYDSELSDGRMPVKPALNGVVYICAGVAVLAGLLVATLTRAREN